MFFPSDYFDLTQTEHFSLFEEITYVWEAIAKIAPYLEATLQPGFYGSVLGKPFLGENVFVGEGTIVEEGAMIKGPAWIGKNCQIRKGAYLRENVIIGDGAVVGNSTEVKNALLFNEAQIPHFNYVGDSILGYKAHLGAGVILSNVRLDQEEIILKTDAGEKIATGRKKLGAILGDHVEVGCQSVLSPGSLIGPRSMVYPLVSWHGIAPAQSKIKKE